MTYVMGIDGGGSTIRVVIVTPDLCICGQSQGPTVNPSVVGAATATTTIRTALRAALDDAKLSAEDIAAVGIGIAGAAASHSAGWLSEVINPVLPETLVVPSADYEIALVGARGERVGVLILAGTGSLAYGVNAAGEAALVGGWGYRLGDEGSGYWIGLEGLRAVMYADDGSGPATTLTTVLLEALDLPNARALIHWLYRSDSPRTHEIAALAPLVLEQVQQSDPAAVQIVQQAANHLAALVQTTSQRLNMPAPAFAFAGGLLGSPNPVSMALCRELGLSTIPAARYTPVMGAALLALLHLRKG